MNHTPFARAAAMALAASAVLLLAGGAGAQPTQKVRDICLDPGGRAEPTVCTASGGRTGATEDFCSCPTVARRVTAPVCPEDVKPPAESAAYERARKIAALDGSLVGDEFEGKPMCIAPLKM